MTRPLLRDTTTPVSPAHSTACPIRKLVAATALAFFSPFLASASKPTAPYFFLPIHAARAAGLRAPFLASAPLSLLNLLPAASSTTLSGIVYPLIRRSELFRNQSLELPGYPSPSHAYADYRP